MVEKILKVFKDGEKDGQYPKPTKCNVLIKQGKGIYNLDLLILRRKGGSGSKIRFPLFCHSQIFHLRWNRYFLQNEDVFACARDIVS